MGAERDGRHGQRSAADTALPGAVDVAAYGLGTVAYLKPVMIAGEAAFAVHAADGSLLAGLDDRDTAHAMADRRALVLLSVH
jgi:hypothetical protein